MILQREGYSVPVSGLSPGLGTLDPPLLRFQVSDLSSLGNHRSPSEVRCSGLVSQLVEHHFPSILQLQAEPVPAYLIFSQLIGSELLVHPAFTLHLEGLPIHRETALGHKPGETVVLAGRPGVFSFAAVPIGPLEDQRL